MSDKQGEGRRSRRWLRAEYVCAAVAVVCFLNALPNDFCCDDVQIVKQDQRVNEPGQWAAIWTTDYWSAARDEWPNRDLLFRPVALSTYRIVRMIGGAAPWPQHVVNILVHALISALVVLTCRRLGGSERTALCAGLVFAVLPIHTEVVAGIVGRADMLATLGVLAAVLSHDRSLRTTNGPNVLAWRVGAALAVFAAMGSKESAVGAALLVVLWDAVQRKRAVPADRAARWWTWRTARRLVYLVVPVSGYFALRYFALEGHLYQKPALTKTVNVLVDAPLWQHLLGVFQSWGMYWLKTVWPGILCVEYSINSVRLATSPLDPYVLVGALVTVALLAAVVVAWRRRAFAVVLAAVALVVSYAPTANALVLIQVFFAERIWYLPSVWVVILIGWLVAPVLRQPSWRAIGIVIVVAMSARCWLRSAEWRDNGTLYASAHRDHPDGVQGLNLYGQWLVDHGDRERGIDLLDRAVSIDMGFTDAHRALGRAHLREGNLEGALRHLQAADMQVPGHRSTGAALATVTRELAVRSAEELAELERKAEAAPDDVGVQLTLVRKLRDVGRLEDARRILRRRDHRFPASSEWQTEYAVTLVLLNDRDGAIDRYRAALELRPDHPRAAVELAMLLLERREDTDIEEAWELSTRAKRLAPHDPFVLVCRAELLALRGDIEQAVAVYRDAIRALPPNSPQRRAMEERARALGG